MSANLENSAVATGLEKVSVHSNPKERQCQRMFKLSHNCTHLTRFLQARLQHYVNQELPDVQTGFRKGRGTRDQIANIRWIIEKERIPEKTSTSASLTTLKLLTCVDHSTLGRFFKRWNSRPPYLPPEKSVCRSRSNS